MIQSLKMALKSIAGNKIRAFLTMLGIIIGVLTLVVLVSLVSGTTQTVTDTISALGTDLLTVEIDESYARSLTMDDMESWMEEDSISAVAAIRQTSMTGKYAGTSDSITVYGTNPAYYNAQNMELLFGRFLKSTDLENSTYVCVLSKGAAEALIGYADCLGHEISLNGIRFETRRGNESVKAGEERTAMLRPEGIRVAEKGILPCRVTLSCFMGSYQYYHVMVGDTLVKITDNHPVGRRVFNTGEEAWLDFSRIDAHLM